MKRSWQKLGFVSFSRRAQTVSVHPNLPFHCRRDFSTTFPALSSEAQDEPVNHPFRFRRLPGQLSVEKVRAQGKQEMQGQLKRSGEPKYSDHTKIYERYILAVGNRVRDSPLPLEIHQAVLRACTPRARDIHPYTVKLFREHKLDRKQLTHPYEARFRRIMQNIVDAGFNPSVKDYHFIMSQFAAVGHSSGIRHYMRQMEEAGLEPGQQAFGFLLQAISYRTRLPASKLARPTVTRELVGITVQVLREMFESGIPPSPTNLDLAFKILSQAYDLQGLVDVLRVGYGVDLNYLDSPPMDTASTPTVDFPPFSTNTLNSLLETLGRWGLISKMVYAFETLTRPLPTPAKTDNAIDDDDDFSPIQQEWKPPSVKPNSTSFNTLIQHCVDHKYPALAKHYVKLLMWSEHRATARLRYALREKPLSEVWAPRVGVSVATLRRIHGFANRTHDIALLNWLIRACKLAVRGKYRSWMYYDQTRSKYDPQVAPLDPGTPSPPESPPSSPNISSSSSEPSNPPTFNIHVHLWLLKNDIVGLSDLKRKAVVSLINAVNKCKARLGRRVWNGKDVYLRDRRARSKVDREVWKGMVNYRKDGGRRVGPKPMVKRYSGERSNPATAGTESPIP